MFDLKKHRKILLTGAAAGLLIVALTIFWQLGDPPDTIYAHTYIHGVAVGGKTAEEADSALMQRFQAGLESKIVRYYANGEAAAEFMFADFGARFDFSALIEAALTHSHGRGIPRRIARASRRPYNISAPPVLFVSAERMEDIMRELSAKLDVPAKNAMFFENADGEITVEAESVGFGVDIEAAAAATRVVLQSFTDGAVELRFITDAPLFVEADFDFTPLILGQFETPCVSENDEPRKRNIARAAEKIHNQVVFPGEVFSAGAVIAANVPESGYEASIVLVRGRPAEDIGGGVCQVVTTLYNAVLLAELEVVRRHNHSARVSYVDLGFDATIAGDYYDLVFKNDTPYPILLTSRQENGRLFVKIFGNETRDPARTLRFEVRQVALFPPEPYREVVDPTVPRGIRQVTLESQMGYHIELFKHIYINGEEVGQIKVNTSMYRPLQGIIAIGAG